MKRGGVVTTFLVGAWWGARLTHWLTRGEVELARARGYMEGGFKATKIHGDVMREYGQRVRGERRRRWFS